MEQFNLKLCLHGKRGTMVRPVLITVTFVSISAVTPAAPVPKGAEKPVLYCPTTVGTKWTYELDGKEFTNEITKVEPKWSPKVVGGEIKVVEEKAGAVFVYIGRLDCGGSTPQEVIEVSEKGLCYRGFGYSGQEPAPCWLRIPARVGDSWKTTIVPEYPAWSFRDAEEGTMTVRSIESITVPAGTFEAIHLEGRCQRNGKQFKEQRWYAPRVGLVKCVSCSGEALVLKSISVPK